MDPANNLPSYSQLLRRTDAPPGSTWFLFGHDDQIGTLNLLRLNSLTAAARHVRTGEAFSLDLATNVISPSLAPTRQALQHHIFSRTPFHRDEWIDSFYPQYGSQIDGLRHIAHPDYGFYNGTDAKTFAPGTPQLSIHHLTELPIAGRAVLLDVDRYLDHVGRPLNHAADHPVTVTDLQETAEHQQVDLAAGDILLIRFGWLTWYRELASPETRANLVTDQRHPGLVQSHDVVAWLWDHRISLVAADNFALECWPAQASSPFFTEDERRGHRGPHAGIMHRALLGLLGLPIGELWDLDALAAACAADNRYTCLLTVAPIPLVGGVGSPANATALR